jgi:hypothetical protein
MGCDDAGAVLLALERWKSGAMASSARPIVSHAA